MPTSKSFKIEGLSELLDGLEELTSASAINVQKRALTAAGRPIQQDAQTAAPHRTGFLQRSITISARLSPRQKKAASKESKIEIYVGPPSMARAIVGEFGSVKQTPKPFMRPAWDANKQTALKSIKGILEDEIEAARKRALAKTARYQK